MNETLKLILDLVVRNANGGRQVADDVKRLRLEATGSSRPLNSYERDLERVGKQAGRTASDVARLRREIQDTNRIVLTDKRGSITGGSVGAAVAAGGAGRLAGAAGLGSIAGFGLAAFGGPVVVRELSQFATGLADTQSKMEGLSATLGVLGERFDISRAEIAGTENRLRSLGLTTVQSRESIRDFTRAGASQQEIITLTGLAMDSAARQGLTLDDAISRLTRATLKAEPELLDELGIVIKLDQVYRQYAKALGISNANTLTVEQRSRALVEALTKQADAGGEFAAQAETISGTLLQIDQTGKTAQERLSNIFSGPVSSVAEAYLGLLRSIDGALKDVESRQVAQKFIDEARGITGPPNQIIRQQQQAADNLSRRPFIEQVFGIDAAALERASKLQFLASAPSLVQGSRSNIKALAEAAGAKGLEIAAQAQGERESAAKLAKELREKLDPIAQRLIEGLALEKLDGIAQIRLDRDQTLSGLKGASPALLAQVRAGFEAREARELIDRGAKLSKDETSSAAETRQLLFEGRSAFVGPDGKTRTAELDDNAKRGQQFLLDRVKQSAKDVEQFNQSRVRQIEQIADTEERLIQLRSRDGSEIRDVLALRLRTIEQIAAIEGETARVAEGRIQARLDAETQLAQLERDRLDRGRQAAESAFDAVVSGGGGGINAFLRSQVLGIGRTVTGNLAEQVLANSGTLGLDGLIGGQTKNGQLTGIGKLLQGTALGVNPADLQRENISALGLNTAAVDRLTGAFSGRGTDGTALTPLRKSIGEGIEIPGLEGIEGLDIFFEKQDATTKETNQLLGKIIQAGVFGAGGAASVVGGVRRGGVGGGLQTASGVLGIAAAFPGPQQPFLQAAALATQFASTFFGQDPLKREKQIQDELNRNRFNAPESVEREFDTFGRSVESGPNGTRQVNVYVSTMDAKSFMDNRSMIGEAARVAFNEDGGATYSDFRREFEG